MNDTKLANIKKLLAMGYSILYVSRITGVNRVTIYDYTKPGFYEKRKKSAVERGKREKENPFFVSEEFVRSVLPSSDPSIHNCELCDDSTSRKYYHTISRDEPECGIWVCTRCLNIALIVDGLDMPRTQGVVVRYHQVKAQILEDACKQNLWALEAE